ncbi:MAG: hypothetical protein M0Z67_04915 [Nitrospiraceae bacterium]|nr:hypothetical protein [Nitrospiraceae bacterium]
MNRMLVIDDDRELCELLSDYLKPEGFDVEAVFDGAQGVVRALSGEHKLVVLDVMLPGIEDPRYRRELSVISLPVP